MKMSQAIDVLGLFLGFGITTLSAPICAQPNLPAPPAPEIQPSPPQTTMPPAQLRSYIGIGAAIGLSGSSTALSGGGLVVFGKQVLSNNLSIQATGIYFGNRVAFDSIALAVDFPMQDEAGNTVLSPFLAGGAMLRTENGSTYFDPLVATGVDLPLSQELTGLFHINVGFPSERQADIGALVGVGYNF
jgi:hypothetical protein